MTIYLTIITTVLVLTQIIRILQNRVSLKRQEKIIQDEVTWVGDCDIRKEDYENQRKAYALIIDYFSKLELKEQENEIIGLNSADDIDCMGR